MTITAANHFTDLHSDAVLWKAHRLYDLAKTPDEKAEAIQSIASMLHIIGNDVKREEYIIGVKQTLKLKGPSLNKEVKSLKSIAEKKRKDTEERMRMSQNLGKLEEYNLPEDFEGGSDEVHYAIKFGVYAYKGVYWARGNKADYEISNFTMKVLYQTKTSDEKAYRLIAFQNVYGYSHVINLNTDDFVSLGSFKKVIARFGNYIFKGTDADLCRLQEFLQKDEINAKFINILGYQKKGNFWAWGNGILPIPKDPIDHPTFIPADEYGICVHNEKSYFLPATSSLYADQEDIMSNEKKFVYQDKINGFGFTEWSSLLYKVYREKAIPGLMFIIAAVFRDVVMHDLQRFPILNLFGPPGSGKTAFLESILSMFGEMQNPIKLEGASTVVGFMRKVAQLKNGVVAMDEYKNNIPTKAIGSLKNLYDGTGYERGKMTNDFSTDSTPVHSSTILAGQEMPTQDPALFMRCILLTFETGKFTEEQREASRILKNNWEEQGLSYITSHIIQFRTIIANGFRDRYNEVLKSIRLRVNEDNIEERYLLNNATLLTFHSLLEKHLQFPFSYKTAEDWMVKNMRTQSAIGTGNNDTQRFWQVVESLFVMDMIKYGRDFMVEGGDLYLRLQNVHPLYMKEMRQRGETNVLGKQSLEHYLKLDKGSFKAVVRKRFEDGTNSSCFCMVYKSLDIDLMAIKEHGLSDHQKAEKLKQKLKDVGLDDDLPESDNPFD